MSKKGKILSMATVLLLVLSLVAVIPAGLAGAQTSGTVKFIDDDEKDVEFYSINAGFNVATIQVEDADENVVTRGRVRFEGVGGDDSLDLTDVDGSPKPIWEGEEDVRTEFTFDSSFGPDGIDDSGGGDDIAAGSVAAAKTCIESSTAGQWMCTLPEDHRLGDANGDGIYDAEDASYVRDTSRSRQVDVGETNSPIRAVHPGNDEPIDSTNAELPTITVDFDDPDNRVGAIQPGVSEGADDTVTLSYETYGYDIREPSNTPIDLSGHTIQAGDSFDNTLNPYDASSASSTAGTINVPQIDNADTHAFVVFRYNRADVIGNAQVRSNTSGSSDAVTLDLNETSASSGKFRNTVGLVTDDELDEIDDRIDQALDADDDTRDERSEVDIGPKSDDDTLLNEIHAGADGMVADDGSTDEDESEDNNEALADRLSGMLTALNLADTDTAEDLLARLLPVADGDTITASYSDRSPSATRRGTATVDLTPPTINVIEPANNLRTRDNTPRFHLELTDAGAGISAADDVDLVIDTSTETTVPVAIDDGFRIEFIPASRLSDGPVTWYVVVVDAVGNSVIDETGGENKPFSLNVDIASIDNFDAVTGFGVNEVGSARTGSVNTAVQLTFEEPVDGESVVAGDFEVSGVTPQAAFHAAQLENTETVATETDRTFEIVDFEAVDTDEDEDYNDEYTVRDADGNSLPVASTGTDENTVVLTAQADIEEGDVITITYTFDASRLVFLTVAALDDDATPRVEIVAEISDSAGNLTDEDDDVTAEAEDGINPVLIVTLDSDMVGDPDGNGVAEGTITITSSEPLSSAPDISYADDEADEDNNMQIVAFRQDAGKRLKEVTDDLVWTLEYATDNSVTDMVITATGTDTSDNKGTSEGVELTTDVDAPPSATFTPAKEDDSDDAVEGVNQGLDNVVRITADWSEEDTVVLTSTLSGGSLEGTVDVSANTFGEGNVQVLGIVLDAGDYTWSIQVEDAFGNDSEEQSINFEVVTPTSFEIDLEPGWNLISIPTRLDAALPGSVFGDENPTVTRIRTWSQVDGWRAANYVIVQDDPATADVDESSGTGWAGDILALSPGAGYYVFSETGENVETALRRIPGLVTPPPPQPLGAGWNLIGPQFFNLPITSETGVDADAYLIDVDWSVAYGFDADPSVGFDRIAPGDDTASGDMLNAGSGYWVYLTADGEVVH